MADKRTESDWRRHREMSEELRSICVEAVGNCGELDAKAREHKNAVGSIQLSVFDESYLEFLQSQIDLEPRGPEWSFRLTARKKNLSPYVNREIASCRLQVGRDDYSIHVDPLSCEVIHWENYEESL